MIFVAPGIQQVNMLKRTVLSTWLICGDNASDHSLKNRKENLLQQLAAAATEKKCCTIYLMHTSYNLFYDTDI